MHLYSKYLSCYGYKSFFLTTTAISFICIINYLQRCQRYVKKERKEIEIKIIVILITDNLVTLFLHDSTLSRRLFNNETRLHALQGLAIPKKKENKTSNH